MVGTRSREAEALPGPLEQPESHSQRGWRQGSLSLSAGRSGKSVKVSLASFLLTWGPSVRTLRAEWQGRWPRASGSPSLEEEVPPLPCQPHSPRAGLQGQSQELFLSRSGPPSFHLRRLRTSAEAPAPPGPSPGHLVLRPSPSTVRPSLLALWGSQHTTSSRRHLLSVSPRVAAWRTDSGCGHRGGQELCPCSPALAPENSEASGAKLCRTSISQGACKRLTPGAQARRASC